MPSVTYWNRMEPRPSTDDISSPLQAKVRDPLWMLTRQWQLGEFGGIDSGSPAWVELAEHVGSVDSWLKPDGTTTPLAVAPLEQQLLREPFSADLATRIELGQALSRLLAEAAAGDAPFRQAFPIAEAADDATDPDEAQLRRVCAGRAVDGVAAYQAIKNGTAPAAPASATSAFVTWVEETLGPAGDGDASTWQAPRLEYQASLHASSLGGTATLDVFPGDDGQIDWAAFDLRAQTSGRTLTRRTRTIVPAHVRFKGMPNARFWDFENGTLDFGDLKPDKRDLARLALMDFMLVHANDWFMLPVDVPLGGTYQLDTLLVHDVFGVDTLIERADRENLGGGRWSMFTTSVIGSTNTADFFLVPPSASAALLSGRVVEEVRFARDEMANMAWAIENVLPNASGDPWPQQERDAARNPVTTPPTVQSAALGLKYQVESRVPEYWIPLLPVSLDPAAGQVALEVAGAVAADGTTVILPRGRILRPTSGSPYQLPEEEVPRNGVRVQRFSVRARWTDGSTRVWQQRRIQPGTGETSSALRFDQALPNS